MGGNRHVSLVFTEGGGGEVTSEFALEKPLVKGCGDSGSGWVAAAGTLNVENSA
jgi:hypothetical protein